MAKRSKARRRRRRAPPAAEIDFISNLGDDVLVRVLELLPDARDAVRTGSLSRRWCGLWTRVPALRFAPSSKPEFSFRAAMRGARRYAAFVNRTLALRAAAKAEPAVEHLAISFTAGKDELRTPPPFVVRAMASKWIRYAVQNGVRSFALELRRRKNPDYLLRYRMDHRETGDENIISKKKIKRAVNLDALPSSATLQTLRLELDFAKVKLPATATFASLTDLALECVSLAVGGGDLLTRLVSRACCPSLRKLRLARLTFAETVGLGVENDALAELWVEEILDMQLLVLATPGLRVLHLKASSCDQLQKLYVWAPRLEELTCLCLYHWLFIQADADWPCMRKLTVQLFSHDEDNPDHDVNDEGLFLLQLCSSVTCLQVSLEVLKREDQVFDLIEGRIPQFPHMTSLIVHVNLWGQHSLGAGVASLLTQCCNLKYLSLHLSYSGVSLRQDDNSELDPLCDHPDNWESNEISLVHLQRVELDGLIGTACELRFIRFVLTGAAELQKVTLRSEPECWRRGNEDAFKLHPPQVSEIWDCDSYLLYKWRRFLCEETE